MNSRSKSNSKSDDEEEKPEDERVVRLVFLARVAEQA